MGRQPTRTRMAMISLATRDGMIRRQVPLTMRQVRRFCAWVALVVAPVPPTGLFYIGGCYSFVQENMNNVVECMKRIILYCCIVLYCIEYCIVLLYDIVMYCLSSGPI